MLNNVILYSILKICVDTHEKGNLQIYKIVFKWAKQIKLAHLNTKFVDDGDLHDWSRSSVYFMVSKAIIKGVGENRFNAKGNAKVEEAIAIAYRCVEEFVK